MPGSEQAEISSQSLVCCAVPQPQLGALERFSSKLVRSQREVYTVLQAMKYLIVLLLVVGAHANPEIDAEIEGEVQRRVERLVTAEAVAERLKLPSPVRDVTSTLIALEKAVEAAILKEIGEKKSPQAYRTEAVAKVPLLQVGDEVELIDTRGRVYRGKLTVNGPGRIKVGNRLVAKRDLQKQYVTGLDADLHRAYVQRYVKNKLAGDAEREDAVRAVRERPLRKHLYQEAGYVEYRGRWRKPKELLQQALSHYRKSEVRKLRPKVEAEVYGRYGYVQVGEEWELPDPERPADPLAAEEPVLEEDVVEAEPTEQLDNLWGDGPATPPVREPSEPEVRVEAEPEPQVEPEVVAPAKEPEVAEEPAAEIVQNDPHVLPAEQFQFEPGMPAPWEPAKPKGFARIMLSLGVIGMKIAAYLMFSIMSGVTLWLGAKLTGVELNILGAIVSAALSQLVRVFLDGFFLPNIIAMVVMYAALYKFSNANDMTDLYLLIVVANAISYLVGLVLLAQFL